MCLGDDYPTLTLPSRALPAAQKLTWQINFEIKWQG